jgi:hypothetical protein
MGSDVSTAMSKDSSQLTSMKSGLYGSKAFASCLAIGRWSRPWKSRPAFRPRSLTIFKRSTVASSTEASSSQPISSVAFIFTQVSPCAFLALLCIGQKCVVTFVGGVLTQRSRYRQVCRRQSNSRPGTSLGPYHLVTHKLERSTSVLCLLVWYSTIVSVEEQSLTFEVPQCDINTGQCTHKYRPSSIETYITAHGQNDALILTISSNPYRVSKSTSQQGLVRNSFLSCPESGTYQLPDVFNAASKH